jgi:shikimate dehydrogenase
MKKKIKKFAVLGHPIAHSLSPQIHLLFAKEFAIDLEYKKFDINPDNFFENVKRLETEGYQGLNITLPLKNAAFHICDQLSERSSLCRSVNTITFLDNNIIGDSTDGRGLLNDLSNKKINTKGKNIFLIGAGGAANGAIYDLIQSKPKKIFLTNRTFTKSIEMKKYWKSFAEKTQVTLETIDLDFSNRLNFDLIINATSSSLTNQHSPLPEHALNCLKDEGACYDMMYGSQTPFMKEAYKKTDSVYDGLGMLVEQAAASFNIWHQLAPATEDIEASLKNL